MDLGELGKLLLQLGLPGSLVVIIVLIVHDPERAVKLKELLFLPCFRLFKWGSRRYIAAKVGYATTEFFRRHLLSFLSSSSDVKVRINWVTSPSDPVLSADGTLILRLQETNDQTRNILAAARLALPRVLCTTLRPHVQKYAQTAIDLAVLRTLTERLGKHARPVFQKYFLGPESEQEPKIIELFRELVTLDQKGLFVAVFLEELTLLADAIYASSDSTDKTEEIISFIAFLMTLARRQVGQEIKLEHLSRNIRAGLVLLAKSKKAEREGIRPYLKSIDSHIKRGCDSIYVLAFPEARDFLDRLLNGLNAELRLSVATVNDVRPMDYRPADGANFSRIALLQRNTLFTDSTFAEKLDASGIAVGAMVQGTITDLADDVAIVDVAGVVCGLILRSDCSWLTVSRCNEVLTVNTSYQFIVIAIDRATGKVQLSLRFPDQDPWKSPDLPKEGDTIDVTVSRVTSHECTGLYRDNIQVTIPVCELSWYEADLPAVDSLVGNQMRVIIFTKSDDARRLYGSKRRLVPDPWPAINKRLAIGTSFRGAVREVTRDYVKVDLPDGLTGFIPKEAMIQGGHEYADFLETVVKGQKLDVVVARVFVKRQKIQLALKRVVRGNR